MAATAVVRIEAPAALEDELIAELWALGCEGSWTESASGSERIRLHAYFPASEPSAAEELAGRWPGRCVEVSAAEAVPDRDWLAEYRARVEPIEVGRRFVVDPREPEEWTSPGRADGRWLLRLPARTAFGVGSHETTALAVELLESLDLAGKRVLDVGTGTGILALAAVRLGARSAVALDIDPAAALLLPAACRWNGVRLSAFAGTVAALDPSPTEPFDAALVNVVPAEIGPALPRLATLLRAGATGIFSGILACEAEAAAAGLAAAGFRETSRRRSGEWIALLAERLR